MSLEFNIEGEPPGMETIAEARAAAAAERAALRRLNIRFLIVVLVLVVTIMCVAIIGIIPTLDDPGAEPDIVGLFAYLTPYLFLTVFVVGNTLHHDRVEKPRKVLEARMEALSDAEPAALERLDPQTLPPLAARYLRRVTAQGRTLLNAELTLLCPDLQPDPS